MSGGVGIYLGCCGAPADWAGRQDLMKENIEKQKELTVFSVMDMVFGKR